VRKILAADCACEEECFEKEGAFLSIARKVEGARRFPVREKSLAVTTMGAGQVVTCSSERLRWVKNNLTHFGRNQLFFAPALARMERYVSRDRQHMAGPDLKHICTEDTFQPFHLSGKINILTYEEQIPELYSYTKFPNALGYHYNPERPRKIVVVARLGDRIVGMAGASADSDEMWQIGVDVLHDFRLQGIGKAMVSELTVALFKQGVLPYYSTAIANLASRRLAISLGYRPAWIEAYATDLDRRPSAVN
jgi:RimJ/RimL family protein N-acetyltransferase